MANRKISELATLDAPDPSDWLTIVDRSALINYKSEIRAVAGAGLRYKTITVSETLNGEDRVVFCDATLGPITVTLPAAADSEGKTYDIKKTDNSANAVIVDGNGAETIDDQTTQTLSSQYDSLTLFCNGSEWWIL